MSTQLERDLEKLNQEIVNIGTTTEKAIQKAVMIFMSQDKSRAKEVSESDYIINNEEKKIVDMCLQILLIQQPVASDLRRISSTLKMVTDVERIGDQAADICEITYHVSDKPYIIDMTNFKKIAAKATEMVNKSIDAFVSGDIQAAHEVIESDDIVDDLFIEIRTQLIKKINDNIHDGEQAADLIMVAKYFERIADHATNIAEWVIYANSGELPKD